MEKFFFLYENFIQKFRFSPDDDLVHAIISEYKPFIIDHVIFVFRYSITDFFYLHIFMRDVFFFFEDGRFHCQGLFFHLLVQLRYGKVFECPFFRIQFRTYDAEYTG